jgi:uncharacterized protein (DUF934 family)
MNEVTDGSTYKKPAGWRGRLRAEGDQLEERLGKLREFLKGEGFKGLDVTDQELLVEQEGLMTRLLAVLGKRLGRASAREAGGAPGST